MRSAVKCALENHSYEYSFQMSAVVCSLAPTYSHKGCARSCTAAGAAKLHNFHLPRAIDERNTRALAHSEKSSAGVPDPDLRCAVYKHRFRIVGCGVFS